MILHVLVYLVQKVLILIFKKIQINNVQKLTKDNIQERILILHLLKKYKKIDNIDILAQRLSYVGEYGFELYMDINNSNIQNFSI